MINYDDGSKIKIDSGMKKKFEKFF